MASDLNAVFETFLAQAQIYAHFLLKTFWNIASASYYSQMSFVPNPRRLSVILMKSGSSAQR